MAGELDVSYTRVYRHFIDWPLAAATAPGYAGPAEISNRDFYR